MSRRTKIYRRMVCDTIDETAAKIVDNKQAAKDTGSWLKNRKSEGYTKHYGKTCSQPMNPDKARRIAVRLHSQGVKRY